MLRAVVLFQQGAKARANDDTAVSTRCLVISGAGKAGPDVCWDMSVDMGI
ncbi:hypothetical protein GCM10009628_10710 [Paeniglutamicibacter kerguelensis]